MIAQLSEQTCGEPCWHAREDVCRCSCGGKNHGCLRVAGAERPVRTCRIRGVRYELKGVGPRMTSEAMQLNEKAGCYYWPIAHGATDFDKCVAKVRPATREQARKWPELSAFKAAAESSEWFREQPELLWVRAEN